MPADAPPPTAGPGAGAGKTGLCVVLGNGPSLRGLDLRRLSGVHTLGMNAAYRHWDRIGWYPDVYACLDDQVIETHHAEIRRLHAGAHVARLFLHGRFFEIHPDLAGHPAFVSLDQVVGRWYQGRGAAQGWAPLFQHPAFRMRGPEAITTGGHATRFAAFLGFRRLALAGIDLRYVEQLPEAEAAGGIALVMRATPAENPNYFFADYQRAGDRFNLPNPAAHDFELHPRAFAALAADLPAGLPGIEIVNTSPDSLLAERAILPLQPLEAVLAREAADPAPPPAPLPPPPAPSPPAPSRDASPPDAEAPAPPPFEARANAPLAQLRRLGRPVGNPGGSPDGNPDGAPADMPGAPDGAGGGAPDGPVVFGRHIVPGLWLGADTERGRYRARVATGPGRLLEAEIAVEHPGRWLTLNLAVGGGALPEGALIGVVCDLETDPPAAPGEIAFNLRTGLDWGFADLALSQGAGGGAAGGGGSRLRVALAPLGPVPARPARWRNLTLTLPQRDGRVVLRDMRVFLVDPPETPPPAGQRGRNAGEGTGQNTGQNTGHSTGQDTGESTGRQTGLHPAGGAGAPAP